MKKKVEWSDRPLDFLLERQESAAPCGPGPPAGMKAEREEISYFLAIFRRFPAKEKRKRKKKKLFSAKSRKQLSLAEGHKPEKRLQIAEKSRERKEKSARLSGAGGKSQK